MLRGLKGRLGGVSGTIGWRLFFTPSFVGEPLRGDLADEVVDFSM